MMTTIQNHDGDMSFARDDRRKALRDCYQLNVMFGQSGWPSF
jgi:hypothetical protein